MALAVIERWTREQSRQSWGQLRSFAGMPLGIALAIVGLWPLLALVDAWQFYAEPLVAVAVYVASQALVWGLWWRGRRGVTQGEAAAAGAVLGGLSLLLTVQVDPTHAGGSALWLGSSGVTVPMLLGFSRPLWEALVVLGVLALTNVAAIVRSGADNVRALHDAPLHIGMPVAVAAGGLALVAAMRRSAINTSRSRTEAETILQRRRTAELLDHERNVRFGPWQHRIAPLLEQLSTAAVPLDDPATGARCRALAAALRAELNAPTRSVLQDLITPQPGVSLTIRDVDTAHRLLEDDRVALVQLISTVCAPHGEGALQLTVLSDGDDSAVAILAADGLPTPDDLAGGTLTADGPDRWWLDLELRCHQAAGASAESPM